MTAESVDGMDVSAVETVVAGAAAAIRRGEGPRFIECRTYRFRAHSMFDPELYRDKAEVERWKERDPIRTLQARLKTTGDLTDEMMAAIEADIAAEIATCTAFAEAGTWEPVEDLLKDVYTPRP
jgi:TPP-dependent pyruvate/acetoin dehydrogenase alpha subunit